MIYSEEWYCDSKGNPDLNGGYGCSIIQDLTTGGILSCRSSSDPVCPSVPALSSFVVGKDAEFVIELEQQPAFTDFTPQVQMAGSAYSTGSKNWNNVNSDPAVLQLTDFTNSPLTKMQVAIGTQGFVCFNPVAAGTNQNPPLCPTPAPSGGRGGVGGGPDVCPGYMNETCPYTGGLKVRQLANSPPTDK